MNWLSNFLKRRNAPCEAPSRAQIENDAGYYVYVHQDLAGRIFYIGKGTRNRAWSEDREVLWKHYVETRLNGQYEVRIVAHGLSEDDALAREAQLMEELADQVVNRQNMGRRLDLQVHERIVAINRERDSHYAEGAASLDPVEKVRLFKLAMKCHQATSKMCSERGIVGKLLLELPLGHMALLDSLIRAYIDLSDAAGASDTLDSYLASFPHHGNNKQLLALKLRVERLRTGRKVRGSAKVAEFRAPDVLPLGWERTPENGVLAIRLKRSPRMRVLHYLDTVEPLKQFRREGKYTEALELMKAAIVSAELESERKGEEWGAPPPFYYREAAKACRDLGDFLQECLFLDRYLRLTRASGRQNAPFITRLGVAAAKLETT